MSKRLFLQFPDGAITDESALINWYALDDTTVINSGSATVDDLINLQKKYASYTAIVLVPSTDCLVTTVAIPTKQRRQQLKAIPFALEEQIAEDIETMHFAIGKRLDNGQLPVIAVAKTVMQSWLDVLKTANFSLSAMLPTSSLLEAPEGAWSIFQNGETYIVNQNGTCWSATADESQMMLQLSIESIDEDKMPTLLFWGEDEIPNWISDLGLEISHQIIRDPQLSLLMRFDTQNINLLQGEFTIQNDWQSGWKLWRSAAVLAMAAVLLKFVMLGFQNYQLGTENDYLKSEINATYHQVAPGARIVAVKQQMQQLLAQKKGGQLQSGSFLVMLGQLGEGLAAIPDIRPTNLNYDSSRGEIRLDLLVSNLPLLDKLKDNLVSKGLSIEVGGASAQGSDYSGRLIIRSGS